VRKTDRRNLPARKPNNYLKIRGIQVCEEGERRESPILSNIGIQKKKREKRGKDTAGRRKEMAKKYTVKSAKFSFSRKSTRETVKPAKNGKYEKARGEKGYLQAGRFEISATDLISEQKKKRLLERVVMGGKL